MRSGKTCVRIQDLEVLPALDPGRDSTILRLSGDDGRIGLAEAPSCYPPGILAQEVESIRSRVVGSDPARFARLASCLSEATGSRPPRTAITLIEIAACDLAARALGVPFHRLIGGAVRDRVRACASGWEPAHGGGEPLASAASRALDAGYRALRLDPFRGGSPDLSRTGVARMIRNCEAVRAAVGPDVAVWIDLRGRFTSAEASRVARGLRRADPDGIIDPVAPASRPALRAIAEGSRLAMAISDGVRDWTDAREAIVERSVDLIWVDPSGFAGLARLRTLAGLAESHGVSLALGPTSGIVGASAALQIACTLSGLRFLDRQYAQGEQDARLGLRPVGGDFLIEDAPGLGTLQAENDTD